MGHKLLIFLLLLACLISCNKSEEKDSGPAGVSVSGAGSTLFGKVKIGEFRVAGIKIKNPTDQTLSFGLTGITAPFSIDGVSGDCSWGSVSPKSECIIKIRFTPVATIESFMDAVVLGTTIRFSGKGLKEGELTLGRATWNAGTFRAGIQQTVSIPVTNTGDTDLSLPRVVNPDFTIVAQNCGSEISPGKSCNMVVGVNKVIAEEVIETVQFYTLNSPVFSNVEFYANVIPSKAAGSIEFVPGATQIIADGSSQVTISSRPIRDSFGNVVSDGETIVATATNLNLTGPMSMTTVAGVVSFTLESTQFTGQSRLILSTELSSGVYNITAVSGPPVGTITAKAYNPIMKANNQTTMTIVTNVMTSNNGNVLTDGTELDVFLTGPGQIITQEFFTFGGVIGIKIKSTTTAGAGSLVVRGNPVRDGFGNITSYLAYGEFPLTFAPVDTIGDFDIVSLYPSIYSGSEPLGLPTTTTVTVRDIRDTNANLVGAGVNVNLTITNGFNAQNDSNNFTLVTDSNSEVTFVLKGNGTRDWINIEALINGASNSLRVFANKEEKKEHNRGTTNKITLKMARTTSDFVNTQLPPASSRWSDVGSDYYSIRSQDSSYFGFTKAFGYWRKLDGPRKHLLWDCIVPVEGYVIVAPCEEKKVSGNDFLYRSYSIMEINAERTPDTFTNANISVLTSYPQAYGAHALGSITGWSKKDNRFNIFGGVIPTEEYVNILGVPTLRYSFDMAEAVLNYSDITLMAHIPFAQNGFDEDIYAPIAPSYNRFRDTTYILGGLRKLRDPDTNLDIVVGSNQLQIYKEGALENITVASGSNGSPVGRYQNGVFFDNDKNALYVTGGLNTNNVFLDEIWKIDMSQTNKVWQRVCSVCGLPDITVKNALRISNMIQTPVDMDEWQDIFEPLRSPVIFKDRSNGKTYISAPSSAILAEVNLDTGVSNHSPTDEEVLEFRSYAQLVDHQDIDRFYRHVVSQPGTSNTSLFHKDGKKGEMAYYMAEITLDEEAKLFGKILTPIISAYSENSTFVSGTQITAFGSQALIYNFNTATWEEIGSSLSSSPNYMSTASYNIKASFTNAPDYISSNFKVYLMIKPRDAVGRQSGGTIAREGLNTLFLNMIRLEGVF